MFDFPREDSSWGAEPTREEIMDMISSVKKEIIQKYHLTTKSGTQLEPPKAWGDCVTNEDRRQNDSCLKARKCLEVTIFTAKTMTPSRYYYLWDDLMENWLPYIS